MRRPRAVANRQRGMSLIELIIFMVIVGVAMAGIISSINYNVQHSADPVVKKQALAIAESMLEEVCCRISAIRRSSPNSSPRPSATCMTTSTITIATAVTASVPLTMRLLRQLSGFRL